MEPRLRDQLQDEYADLPQGSHPSDPDQRQSMIPSFISSRCKSTRLALPGRTPRRATSPRRPGRITAPSSPSAGRRTPPASTKASSPIDQFLTLADDILSTREQVFMSQLENYHEGVLGIVFDTLDRVQHMFWKDQPELIEQWYLKLDAIDRPHRGQDQGHQQSGCPTPPALRPWF